MYLKKATEHEKIKPYAEYDFLYFIADVDYSGKFNSNSDYMNSPVVWGGYVKSDDGVEITIGWTDVDGMADETPYMFHGYSFTAEGVRNWELAARATRDHLKSISEA